MRTRTAFAAGTAGLALAALVALPASAATGSWTIISTIPATVSGGQGVEYSGPLAVDSTRGLAGIAVVGGAIVLGGRRRTQRG
jgi:hypothetical protein